jgi:prevent-host-death family protein
MTHVTIHDAKTNLSKLLVAVQAGEEIVVCKGQQPIAKLVPLREPSRKRPPVGLVTSDPVTYSTDCFSPLTDDELKDWGL